jgi:hypothetical protein
MLADGTWIFVLEALLALVLAVLIVWWTLPRKRARPRSKDDAAARGEKGAPPRAPGEHSPEP